MARSKTGSIYWSFEMSNQGLRLTIFTIAFIALSGLGALSSAQAPIADGLSEVRMGIVDKVDAQANVIVVDGREYRLPEDQEEILRNRLGSAFDEYSRDIPKQSVSAGDRIRYVVDVMAERLGHAPPELFILGVEK